MYTISTMKFSEHCYSLYSQLKYTGIPHFTDLCCIEFQRYYDFYRLKFQDFSGGIATDVVQITTELESEVDSEDVTELLQLKTNG